MGFDQNVWTLTKNIPKGKISTYKIIAEKLGCKVYRAVGNAFDKNPHAPVVLCHRVVNSDGKVGGFTISSKKKIELLKEEGVVIENNKIKNFEKIKITL